jgi:hypothetical protein
MRVEDGIGQLGLAGGEGGAALRLQSEATVLPSSSYRFSGATFLHFQGINL